MDTDEPFGSAPCVVAPVDGELLPLEECSDTVFAQGMVGPGFVIKPVGGEIHAPVNGTVKLIHATGHGFGFDTDNGHEVLLHLGVDTVELGPEPFSSYVHVGDHVKAGAVIAGMKNSKIKAAGKSDEVIVVADDLVPAQFSLDYTGPVTAGQKVGHLIEDEPSL